MALYIGVNYHPHDWERERWKTDIEMMKQAGFTTVRLGHLCWDSYEPEEGVYTFEWFDEVMDLFAGAGIGVVLDLSMRPAPVWVHKLCPGCDIYTDGNVRQPSIRRYMEDVGDPGYQHYALRFAEVLINRYKHHPALFAFGLCNEIGDGFRSHSEGTRRRFAAWLKAKYGTVESLNTAWAARRWSRKLTSFDDVVLPENGLAKGAPEAWLDMRRFFSEENGALLAKLAHIVAVNAPGIHHSSNHYAEKETLGFDYLEMGRQFVDIPGMGFYPGYEIGEHYQYLQSIYSQRLAEWNRPMWCLEFQTGSQGIVHGPYGALYMQAMLCLLNRAQMILGWTWRSMAGGEEQYLYGLLSHDGEPTVNYQEYQRLAADMKKLESCALPYLPVPDTAVAYDYDSDWVVQYSPSQFRLPYKKTMTEVQKAFFELNRDYNVVSLNELKGNYKLLIIPGHTAMSPEEADTVRQYVSGGGTVVMTGYSAVVDEHGQVFSTTMPGYLSDVFGVRVAGFERPDESAYADIHYYEELELKTASQYASFPGQELCAISVHEFGKGKAYYAAAETNCVLLQQLIERLTPELGLKQGPAVPRGIQARAIAENQYFFVNTTSREIDIPLVSLGTGRTKGYGVLTGQEYQDSLLLQPYGAELLLYQ